MTEWIYSFSYANISGYVYGISATHWDTEIHETGSLLLEGYCIKGNKVTAQGDTGHNKALNILA